jgi:hypothetical protein
MKAPSFGKLLHAVAGPVLGNKLGNLLLTESALHLLRPSALDPDRRRSTVGCSSASRLSRAAKFEFPPLRATSLNANLTRHPTTGGGQAAGLSLSGWLCQARCSS